MKKLALVMVAYFIICQPVCHARQTYRDPYGNTIDIERCTRNTANVYVNNRDAGYIEHVPDSRETMDNIDRMINEQHRRNSN